MKRWIRQFPLVEDFTVGQVISQLNLRLLPPPFPPFFHTLLHFNQSAQLFLPHILTLSVSAVSLLSLFPNTAQFKCKCQSPITHLCVVKSVSVPGRFHLYSTLLQAGQDYSLTIPPLLLMIKSNQLQNCDNTPVFFYTQNY